MKRQIGSYVLVFALALILITAMLLFYFFGVKGVDKAAGSKTVTLEIIYADKEYRYEDLETTSITVGELIDTYQIELELGAKWENGIYGRYITELKGTAINADKGCYYTYDVSSADFATGIDEQDIKDGDVITFKYGKSEYDSLGAEVGYTYVSGGDDSVTRTPIGAMKIGFIVAIIVSVMLFSAILLAIIYKNERKKSEK